MAVVILEDKKGEDKRRAFMVETERPPGYHGRYIWILNLDLTFIFFLEKEEKDYIFNYLQLCEPYTKR